MQHARCMWLIAVEFPTRGWFGQISFKAIKSYKCEGVHCQGSLPPNVKFGYKNYVFKKYKIINFYFRYNEGYYHGIRQRRSSQIVLELYVYELDVEQLLCINLMYFCIIPFSYKSRRRYHLVVFELIMNIQVNCEQAILGT